MRPVALAITVVAISFALTLVSWKKWSLLRALGI